PADSDIPKISVSVLWLHLHCRRFESFEAAQSPALVPTASERPGLSPRRSSGSTQPEPSNSQDLLCAPAKRAFDQRRDQNPCPPVLLFPSPLHAAAAGLPGSATEVARPGPVAGPFRRACKL